jgi:hypothetical protein
MVRYSTTWYVHLLFKAILNLTTLILVIATANDIGRLFVEKLNSVKKTKRGLGKNYFCFVINTFLTFFQGP